MSLNNKPTYGTAPAAESDTKGSRRGVVVGLVRPRARKSIHGAFMLDRRVERYADVTSAPRRRRRPVSR